MYNNLFSAGTKAMVAGAFCVGIFISCKKDKGNSPNPPTSGYDTSATVKEDSLKYLMYQIMQVTYGDGGRTASRGLPTYYWYSQVPQLNLKDPNFGTADNLLTAMKGYAINPTTNAPYDRYSFLDRTGAVTNQLMNGVSAQNYVEGTGKLGLDYAPVLDQSGKLHLFVLYADKNSPAGLAGLQRGCEITSVNGNSSFSNTQSSLQSIYNAISVSTSVTLGVVKTPGAAQQTVTLNAVSYNVNPVVFDTVFTVTNNTTKLQEKVGYFVLYTFTSVNNSKGQPTAAKAALDQTFGKFTSQGVKHVIVDLRYNGGGSTNTAEYLDSALAPSSAAGKVMYTYKYNDKITANLNTVGLDVQVNFPSNTGGAVLKDVFFIVSRSTASASELTLNNLKPYMPVHLIGDTTFGKPVGFIDFNITMYDANHKPSIYLADLYAINFETRNANGEGGYYTGIPIDNGAKALDYVNVPWGNTALDQNLEQALNYISNGSYISNLGARMAVTELSQSPYGQLRTAIPNAKPMNGFNGMVDFRLSRAASRLK